MTPAIAYPHIVKENGQPARLENHPRVRVAQIVMDYLAHGWSPEELSHQHYGGVTVAQAYAALAYYHVNVAAIEELLEKERIEVEALKAASNKQFTKEELLARRAKLCR